MPVIHTTSTTYASGQYVVAPSFLSVNSVDNALIIGDFANNRVRAMSLANGGTNPVLNALSPDLEHSKISTLLGSGLRRFGFTESGTGASSSLLNEPMKIDIDRSNPSKNILYIADSQNQRIRSVDLSTGVVRTAAGVAGSGQATTDGNAALDTPINLPFGVAVGTVSPDTSGDIKFPIFFTDNGADGYSVADSKMNCAARIWNRSASNSFSLFGLSIPYGRISTFFGDASQGCFRYGGSGAGVSSLYRNANSVRVTANAAYMVLTYEHCIVKVDAGTGLSYPFLGTCGTMGSSNAGTYSTSSSSLSNFLMYSPTDIYEDPVAPGNFYVTEYGNDRVIYVNTTASGILMNDTVGEILEVPAYSVARILFGSNSMVVRPSAIAASGDTFCVANGILHAPINSVACNANDYPGLYSITGANTCSNGNQNIITSGGALPPGYSSAAYTSTPTNAGNAYTSNGYLTNFGSNSLFTKDGNNVVCYKRGKVNVSALRKVIGSQSGGARGTLTISNDSSNPTSQEGLSREGVGFWGPSGLAFDSEGALYVSDRWNHLIRKVLLE